jgi:hypothetical protein
VVADEWYSHEAVTGAAGHPARWEGDGMSLSLSQSICSVPASEITANVDELPAAGFVEVLTQSSSVA